MYLRYLLIGSKVNKQEPTTTHCTVIDEQPVVFRAGKAIGSLLMYQRTIDCPRLASHYSLLATGLFPLVML